MTRILPADPTFRKEGETMDRKEMLLSGSNRRHAITALTRQERMKYEIAQELGLLERVRQVGWAGLTAQETGRIGGLMKKRKQ